MERYTGILDVPVRADGRIRQLDQTLNIRNDDPLVPHRLLQRYCLRAGQMVTVELSASNGKRRNRRRRGRKNNNNKNQKPQQNRPSVRNIIEIDGIEAEEFAAPKELVDQISVDPQPRLTLEYPDCPPACRLIDLFCPIGFGQRGMIVSPPKAGKTTLLRDIATAITRNHPECLVYALLIDERPEEVTDFRRNVPCEVLASSNDNDAKRHVELASIAIERAKRQAEQGKNVVIMLDSLTRVGRAFNTAPGQSNSGRTMSGGLDVRALSIPKQLFGAARNVEDGGSLTIIATCLIDTGSRGDQVIFEEFKGTGNMELILDRSIAERRIYPAINLAASGTRKDHLLLSDKELNVTTALRRRLLNMKPVEQVEQLLKALEAFETNAELVGGKSG